MYQESSRIKQNSEASFFHNILALKFFFKIMNWHIKDFSFLICFFKKKKRNYMKASKTKCKPRCSCSNSNQPIVHKFLITTTWLCWTVNLPLMFFTTIILNSVIFMSIWARISECKTFQIYKNK